MFTAAQAAFRATLFEHFANSGAQESPPLLNVPSLAAFRAISLQASQRHAAATVEACMARSSLSAAPTEGTPTCVARVYVRVLIPPARRATAAQRTWQAAATRAPGVRLMRLCLRSLCSRWSEVLASPLKARCERRATNRRVIHPALHRLPLPQLKAFALRFRSRSHHRTPASRPWRSRSAAWALRRIFSRRLGPISVCSPLPLSIAFRRARALQITHALPFARIRLSRRRRAACPQVRERTYTRTRRRAASRARSTSQLISTWTWTRVRQSFAAMQGAT